MTVADCVAPPALNILRRLYTEPDGDPYDKLSWELRTVHQVDRRSGEILFHQDDVEVPAKWSMNATQILATKYLRQTGGGKEHSLRQALDRIVDTITEAGQEAHYFDGDTAETFRAELKFIMADQRASFNTPVWFNIGVPGATPQASACFILGVDDTMRSIQQWYLDESTIFLGGSGAGANLSAIRSSKDRLSSGNMASGPVAFMRGADAVAGVIKSGNAQRKAAKMVVLDVTHPDVLAFIRCKAIEGRKARVLAGAGFDMDLDGADVHSVQYQNANNSVRVTDAFMRAAARGGDWHLLDRHNTVVDTVAARDVMGEIAEAAWACADPGLQYADTINRWHTLADTSTIRASNPCSEYLSLDNSACNLASMNILAYATEDGGFDADGFVRDCQLVLLAQEILVGYSSYPTPAIADNARKYRQLGLGYTNLGTWLMCLGLPYDSDDGRAAAAALTSLLGGAAASASASFAAQVGPYDGFAANRGSHLRVLAQHKESALQLAASVPSHLPLAQRLAILGAQHWEQCLAAAQELGVRNSQFTVLAPTGTISYVMDADTTGVEPDFSLVKHKKLVGGGSMVIANQAVGRALRALGYNTQQISAIEEFVADAGTIKGAPGVHPSHFPVFACAVGDGAITPMGHVRMLAAVQPFLSGGISKTINMPSTATVADITEVYAEAWRLGVKAVAVYRDGSKDGQPLNAAGTASVPVAQAPVPATARRRLPRVRNSRTIKFSIAHDLEGYVTVGEYDDGKPGELFIKVSKQGSTLSGIMDMLALAVSVGLQHGVPLETFVAKYAHTKFEPGGVTDDPELRIATSPLDYIFRRLGVTYLEPQVRQALGIWTSAERATMVAEGAAAHVQQPLLPPATYNQAIEAHVMMAPLCNTCGAQMRPSGACFACPECGATTGCS